MVLREVSAECHAVVDAHSVESKLINMGQRCSDTRIINFGESFKEHLPSELYSSWLYSARSRKGRFS